MHDIYKDIHLDFFEPAIDRRLLGNCWETSLTISSDKDEPGIRLSNDHQIKLSQTSIFQLSTSDMCFKLL